MLVDIIYEILNHIWGRSSAASNERTKVQVRISAGIGAERPFLHLHLLNFKKTHSDLLITALRIH